ncbi:MAG: chemotaxis-specific protein-glutamate methyltransferase CheB [Athalassotoga sp.]|uniref:chemotaxis-specific protein-glutamate methyltransferase CheB n=1 Tax=Athalassotoga sp. TaxID=2022597 RepID=UPI003D033560
MEKIKVAIVDDSAFMRKIMRDSLQSRGFEVVAIGRNGQDAIEIASKGIADVMTLDVQMPVLDGLNALRTIMGSFPMPVIMVSSITVKDAEIIIEALKSGAFDFVTKPGGAITFDLNEIIDELSEKLILASKAKISPKISQPKISKTLHPHGLYDILFIGSSTGGPRALDYLIPNLPRDFPVPIVIVQHMPANFTKTLADRLSEESKIRVYEVNSQIKAMPSTGYVAKGDTHLEVTVNDGINLKPSDGPKINGVKPAIDFTLSTIAKANLKILCVILTGMGKDGTEGLKRMKRENFTTIVESEKTAVVYGMPRAVVNAGLADYVLDLDKIPDKIIELI